MHLQVGFPTAAFGVVVVPTSLFLLLECGCQCLFFMSWVVFYSATAGVMEMMVSGVMSG